MEDNQAKCEGAGRSNVCVSYHALSEDWSEIADRTINMLEKIIENEAVHAMLAVLTDKQPFCLSASGELKKAAKIVSDSPVFFKRESKIPLAAFYLFEVPILIGIHKAILEYSFSKNFEK